MRKYLLITNELFVQLMGYNCIASYVTLISLMLPCYLRYIPQFMTYRQNLSKIVLCYSEPKAKSSFKSIQVMNF